MDNPEFLLSEKGSHLYFGALRNQTRYNGISFLDLHDYSLTHAPSQTYDHTTPPQA